MPKLLSPDHNQGDVLYNDSSPIDNTTTLLSDPAVNQTDNVVTDQVDVMSQGSNSNPMYIKSRIINNAQETILSILVDTGARKNLISATTLTSFGKKLPKLKHESIQLCGANGSSLNSLGSVTLFTKSGDKEHLLKFHVINDLATTAILGSHDLTPLNACIDCSKGLISFNGGAPIPLRSATEPTDIVTNYNVSLSPGEHKLVSCRPHTKNHILCSHIATPLDMYKDQLVCNIVDVQGRSSFDILLFNPSSNSVLKIPKNSAIGLLSPVTPDIELLMVDDKSIHDISTEIDTPEPI